MKKFSILFFLALVSTTCLAQDSKREQVEELLALMKVDSMMDTLYSQMEQVMKSTGRQLGVKPEEQEIFDKYKVKLVAAMKSEMSWEKMQQPMIDLYLKHYSEREISDMLAFYRSESGQSMVSKMPAVMADSMQVSQQLVQGFLPKMQQLTDELRTELDKLRGYRNH